MLKRTIFLLSYFAFFILVPIAVYNFWPVQNDFSSPDAQVIVDPNVQDENAELQLAVESYNDSLTAVAGAIYAVGAMVLCFFVSVLVALILAIVKFSRPQKKLGGITLGILIFNVLYLPVYVLAMFLIYPYVGYFSMYFLAYAKPDLSLEIYILAAVFIITIIFLIAGAVRGKKI
jgi:hypothetical protein